MAVAIVLLSGGLDSATVLAIAESEGYVCHVLSFFYGQRHSVELRRAQQLAGPRPRTEVDLSGLGALGGSALTDDTIAVPKGRHDAEMAEGIPATYVPARNTVFLSVALALAEESEAEAIFLGVNALDYSGYPDCRPEFVAAFQGVANLATRRAVEGRPPVIRAPLIAMSKAEIIRVGTTLGVDYSKTSSCYDPSPDGVPCRECDSCRLREKGFAENGLVDPLIT